MKTGEYEKYSIHLFISKSEEIVFKKLIIVFVLCILIFNAAAIIKEAYANNNNSDSSSIQVTIVPPGKVYAPPAPTNQDIISMCAGLKALLHSNEQIDKTIYSTFLKGYNTNCTTVLGRFHK